MTDPVLTANAHVNKLRLVTHTGITPEWMTRLTRYDVDQLLIFAGTLADISNWVLADLLVWIDNETANVLGRSAKDFRKQRDIYWLQAIHVAGRDISLQTAYNLAATARAFPYQERRKTDTLSFEHHRLLISVEDKEAWLEMTEAGEWSAGRLRRELYARGPIHVDMNEPTGWVCPNCGYREEGE